MIEWKRTLGRRVADVNGHTLEVHRTRKGVRYFSASLDGQFVGFFPSLRQAMTALEQSAVSAGFTVVKRDEQ